MSTGWSKFQPDKREVPEILGLLFFFFHVPVEEKLIPRLAVDFARRDEQIITGLHGGIRLIGVGDGP